MPEGTSRARRWAALGALPVAVAALCVLLLRGVFKTWHPLPWALLLAASIGALARWGLAGKRRPWNAIEDGILCAVVVLALSQIAPPLQPLMYLLAAAYVLALPLRLARPRLAGLIAPD